MKKIIFFITLFITFVGSKFQTNANELITGSRISFSIGERLPLNALPSLKINSNSIATGGNISIENATLRDDFTPAFIKAAKLLADGISDDYPLHILIQFGTDDDFSGDIGAGDLLAVTITNFVLNNYSTRNPNTSSSIRNRELSNMLIPQALANRECLSDTDPTNPDMIIKLNPEIDFYTDTLSINIPNDEYDLVTVVLREMVTGCGFGSSLSKTTTNPNNVFFSKNSMASNGAAYPHLFDNYIYNDKDISFNSVENSTQPIYSFLKGNQLFFKDNLYHYATVELYNDVFNLIMQNPTSVTLSTTNKTVDTLDLMHAPLNPGKIIRKITPKTKAVLQALGWGNDLTPSLRFRSCNIIGANGEVPDRIKPNVSYYYKTDIDNRIDWGAIQFFHLCLVKSDGSFYTIAEDNNQIGILKVNYSTLPSFEWQREAGTGDAIGYIFFKSYNPNYNSAAGTNDFSFFGFKKVLLAYPPTSATLSVSKIEAENSTVDANINYSSKGGTSYRINYSISGDPTQHIVERPNKEDIKYVLKGLPANRKSYINVTAINEYGSVTSPTITIGEDPVSTLAIVVTKVGNTLKYRFKDGSQYVTDLTINSVAVYDTNGVIEMTTSAGINEFFNIAGLSPGYHILQVDVAGVTVFSKLFIK